MSANPHELIQRYLEGRATPEEAADLQQALKESADLRALYLDYINLDGALGALADAAAIEGRIISEIPVAQPFRFRWWPIAAAAACLALALGVGLHPHRKQSPAGADLAAVIESTQDAIAQIPTPSPPLPAWMSPTASLLDLDLSGLPSQNSNSSKKPL
jgi:hypothetical protein